MLQKNRMRTSPPISLCGTASWLAPWCCAALHVLGGESGSHLAEPRPSVDLVPAPVRVQRSGSAFELTPATVVQADPAAAAEAEKLAEALRKVTGFPLPMSPSVAAASAIVLGLDATFESGFGGEGYRLEVASNRVTIRAAGTAGLFYGGITLRQLLPPEAFSRSRVAGVAWVVPGGVIEDKPRFPWRGLLIDPARHFLPAGDVEKLLEAMAAHKLNTLQIHLTDDQGWRLEIGKYPRLTEVGSMRAESPKPGDLNRGDGIPYGPFFYTREQIRGLVAYAQARHITLVPEIEMPGHFLAALAAYPQFSCRGGPFRVRTRWGIEPDILCPGNDEAVGFARDILAEVVELFPSRFIHIGGDEAPRDRWRSCPKCQARMKAEGLKTEAQLQTWLNHRLEEFLASRGRRLIGWDEILEGGLTGNAVVMSWRGMEGGVAAAEAGHDVVMSPTSHCYFDYAQARGPAEPESIGGFIPLRTVYEFEPVPGKLRPSALGHILGGQGNIWGEFLPSLKAVDYFAFPRAAALAEVVWSPASSRNYNDFERRLAVHLRRLDALGVNYRRLEATGGRERR